MQNTKQSVMKSGNLNPMWGKKHSSETKNKISATQKARYAAIRKAIKEEDVQNVKQTDGEAHKSALSHLLGQNQLSFTNLALMLKESQIKKIVRLEINKLLNESNKGGL